MAEFCLDCWNRMNGTEDDETKYIFSEDLDLCEGCGRWKYVIIMERKAHYMYKSKCFMKRLIMFLCLIFKYRKSKQR